VKRSAVRVEAVDAGALARAVDAATERRVALATTRLR
jgi:hypothetical protein